VNGLHLLLQAVPRGYLEGYTSDIVQALLALLGVCALAVLAIRFTASRCPRLGLVQGPVRVQQRITLDPRRTLYLVSVGPRLLLLGVGETQGPVLLAEIDPQSVSNDLVKASDPPKGIAERLNRFIHRNGYGGNVLKNKYRVSGPRERSFDVLFGHRANRSQLHRLAGFGQFYRSWGARLVPLVFIAATSFVKLSVSFRFAQRPRYWPSAVRSCPRGSRGRAYLLRHGSRRSSNDGCELRGRRRYRCG